MGFLDNSGDIILDAVLTDAGRARLARADGSFQITKFAFADDEINYGLYNKSHPSGSAYYDLDILQTPVFEAFTNNTSTVKYKLQSISRTNLLYLPILKLNTPPQSYVVLCDTNSEDGLTEDNTYGILYGIGVGASKYIEIHQGLDTTEIPATFMLDSDLKETQYLIEIDNRFGSIISYDKSDTASLSFIDDDSVASYYLSLSSEPKFVENIPLSSPTSAITSTIAGPRGTMLKFKIQASLDLNSSTFLFTQLGSLVTAPNFDTTNNYYIINTNIKVTGVTTGYSINIPVRFAKKN